MEYLKGLKLEEGSYKIISVGPQLEDSGLPLLGIATKIINQLLWDKDAIFTGHSAKFPC